MVPCVNHWGSLKLRRNRWHPAEDYDCRPGAAAGAAAIEEIKRCCGLLRGSLPWECVSNVGKEVGCDEYVELEAR